MRTIGIIISVLILILVVGCSNNRTKRKPTSKADAPLPHYSVKLLVGLPPYCGAQAINSKGEVLVWATSLGDRKHHSLLWSNGKIIDIGTLGGKHPQNYPKNGNSTMAGTIGFGLNDKSQVVGVSQAPDGNNHAFLWEHGKMRDLGTLGGKSSGASDINNLGQVVGSSYTVSGDTHAFIWDQKNGMRDLGITGKFNSANAINNRGQVLGTNSPEWGTFVWKNGDISYLEEHPLRNFSIFKGLRINEYGDVIGVVDRGGTGIFESRVYLFSEGKYISVETPAKHNCNALGLTSDGLVIGNAFDTPTGQHAFAWRNGKMALLNDLLTDQGWDIYFTKAVNDKGQIAAHGKHGKKESIVLLIPLPAAKAK